MRSEEEIRMIYASLKNWTENDVHGPPVYLYEARKEMLEWVLNDKGEK